MANPFRIIRHAYNRVRASSYRFISLFLSGSEFFFFLIELQIPPVIYSPSQLQLEGPSVRAAAVSCLGKFLLHPGVANDTIASLLSRLVGQCNPYASFVLSWAMWQAVLLAHNNRALTDDDDEVRDRAARLLAVFHTQGLALHGFCCFTYFINMKSRCLRTSSSDRLFIFQDPPLRHWRRPSPSLSLSLLPSMLEGSPPPPLIFILCTIIFWSLFPHLQAWRCAEQPEGPYCRPPASLLHGAGPQTHKHGSHGLLVGLHFGSKKTELLNKSSKTIDILPVFFE